MSVEMVIAAATSIVGAMAGAVGLVWRAGEQKAQRIEAVYDLLVKAKDLEITRWQQLVTELRQDSAVSRAADEKLIQTFNTLREAVLENLPARRAR